MKVLRNICILLLLSVGVKSGAQEMSLSTNMLSYVDFGTLNLEASYGFSPHWSVNAGVKYNPFSFTSPKTDDIMQHRQQSIALGTRFWPWHIYSGWWIAGKVQYQEYSVGGIVSKLTSEGDRFGGGIVGGYTYMLGTHLNLEFGLGLWAGYEIYTKYACPVCGSVVDEGQRVFLSPSDIILSLSYVF